MIKYIIFCKSQVQVLQVTITYKFIDCIKNSKFRRIKTKATGERLQKKIHRLFYSFHSLIKNIKI